jgi:hypothetical protein
MPTIYFLVFTIVGGILALFISAGVNSYQYNELPDIQSLFRWFLAGSVTSGLGSYAYIFGANGDPSALIQNIGESMDVKHIVESLSSVAETVQSVGGSLTETETPKEPVVNNDITVGMPGF